MHVNQHRRHEGKPGVGDYVGRLHPPPGSVYIQQFVNRRRESRSGGRPSGKGKGATPRLWRIRRAGEFEEARVPSAPRCPEQAKTGLFEEGASLRIADCGLRIADLSSPRILIYIATPLARDRSPIINPRSAIRNPQSAILNESRTSRRCNSRAPW